MLTLQVLSLDDCCSNIVNKGYKRRLRNTVTCFQAQFSGCFLRLILIAKAGGVMPLVFEGKKRDGQIGSCGTQNSFAFYNCTSVQV